MIILSKSNEKIKYINSLKDKKYRDKYNKYILEGVKVVNEYISSEANCPEFIVFAKDMLTGIVGGQELLSKLEKYDKSVIIEVDNNIFKYLTDTTTPQGVLMVLEKPDFDYEKLKDSINTGEKFIVLDGVSDAGNMGTIIRSAISFGIKNIICTKGTVDCYSNKVTRSTMGAIHKIKIYYIECDKLKQIKEMMSKKGYTFIATDLKADKYINEIKINNKFIYVMGNEANGISKEMKDICDKFVKIPIESIQESLNVSIATSILMYDMYVRGEEPCHQS